jgi:CDGSH iron-sulfur domain-containing protein 3
MPRVITKDKQGPAKVGDKFICQCGLSKNQPFCDGSHKNTLDEDKSKTYCYDKDNKRKEVKEKGCCCC